MTIRQATVPFQLGYDFGVGVDLVSGSPMAKVVDDQHASPGQADGATVDFTIDRVRTTSDLEKSLGIDVDMSYVSAAFEQGPKLVSSSPRTARSSRRRSSCRSRLACSSSSSRLTIPP
jgi:hypothetical protein